MDDLPLGSRVAVRHRLPPDEVTAAWSMTDVLGRLVRADEQHLWVETRGGEVQVARADVVAARVVPPRPVRRGAPHRAVGIEDLHRVMAKGQPGLEQRWLGPEHSGWLLRWGEGWTGRSNSALPVGDPGMPLEEAVTAVADWYAAHGAPPLFMLPRPTGATTAQDPLGAHLLGHGYREAGEVTNVLTGPVSGLLTGGEQPPGLRLSTASAPTTDWFAGGSPRLREHVDVARRVLAVPRRQVFLTAYDDEGGLAATARVALDDGWAGVFGVHVLPPYRGRGVGRWLTRAAGLAIQAAGTGLVYLQVERSNTAAQRLYTGAGMLPHHEYVYVRPA